MFAVLNPPKIRRNGSKKKKLKKGCRRVAIRTCARKTKRSKGRKGRGLPKSCKGLSPEACLADYELSGRVAPRGLKKTVEKHARFQRAAAKGRLTKIAKRADACRTGEMYGWSAIGKKSRPSWCSSGESSDRLPTAAERGYYSVNPRKGRAMKRRKKGKRGSRGYGIGSFLKNPPAIAGYFPTMQTRKISKTIPQLIGLAVNGAVSGFLSSKIPYTRTGIGRYLLSAISAVALGKVASKFAGAEIGQAVQNGGFVGTGVMAVADVTAQGVKAFTNISGYDSDVLNDTALYGYDSDVMNDNALYGMGDFVAPGQIQSASIMPSQAGQYPLPQSVPIPSAEQWTPGGNQSWSPGGRAFNAGGSYFNEGGARLNFAAPAPAAPPGSAAAKAEVVAQAAQGGQMNDYESNILGSVIGDSDSAFDDMTLM